MKKLFIILFVFFELGILMLDSSPIKFWQYLQIKENGWKGWLEDPWLSIEFLFYCASQFNWFVPPIFFFIIYLISSAMLNFYKTNNELSSKKDVDNNYKGNKYTNINEENKFLEKLNETTDFRIKRWKESRALEKNRQSHISQDLEVNETTEDTKELEIKSSKTIDVPNELRESTAQEKTSIEYSDTYSLHKNIENFKGKQTEKNKKEVDKQEEIVNTDEITEEKISEKYNSIVDELTKLGKLKEKGLLTEEEFNEQKKKFLKQ